MKSRTVTRGCLVLFLGVALAARADDQVVLKSKDGHTELVLPPGWRPMDVQAPTAQIAATNPEKHLFAEIVTEDRRDYEGDLQKYGDSRRDAIARYLQDGSRAEGRAMTMNGNPARRYELHGVKGGFKLTYELTVVQIGNDYDQVSTWCGQSRFDDNRGELEKIPQGVRPAMSQEKKK